MMTSGSLYNRIGGLVLPVLLRLADVALVANLGHLLSLGEKFLGLVGISLLDREVTNLTEQERTEQREQSQACMGYAESRRTKTKSSRGRYPPSPPMIHCERFTR